MVIFYYMGNFQSACKNGNDKTVSELLKYQSKEEILSGLLEACINGRHKVVEIILSKVADLDTCYNDNMLGNCACQNGHFEVVKLLFKYEPTSISSSFFTVVCERDYQDLIVWFIYNIKHLDAWTALKGCCTTGKLRTIRMLLDIYVELDINHENSICIREACLNGHQNVVEHFLSFGTDSLEWLDYYLFNECCVRGHKDIIKLFLELNPNFASNMNFLPFRTSSQMEHYDIIDLLWDSTNRSIKSSCFIEACKLNKINLAKYLSTRDEDFQFICKNGKIKKYAVFKTTDQVDECSVCFMDSEVLTYCNHQFCEKCLYNWVQKSGTCPYCRQFVKDFYYLKNNS